MRGAIPPVPHAVLNCQGQLTLHSYLCRAALSKRLSHGEKLIVTQLSHEIPPHYGPCYQAVK
jgi:hypothetical protein